MSLSNHNLELMMCRFFTILAVALLAMTMCLRIAHADEIDDQLASEDYIEGEVIAAFRIDAGQVQARAGNPYKVTELASVDSSTSSSPVSPSAGSSDKTPSTDLNLCLVSSSGLSTEELLRRLSDDPDVVFAEPNYTVSLDVNQPDGESTSDGQGKTEAGLTAQANSDTNPAAQTDQNVKFAARADSDTDTSLPGDLTHLQWGNWSTDQTIRAEGMAANPSINVPGFGAAGSDGNMNKKITVALLDTGVYYKHPDLQNVLYHFTPEQQAELGCWEWGYNALGKGIHGNEYDAASTEVGHGTHTAGIIGAEWNGSGTSGVASNVRIVCIEHADSSGVESLADAIAAFAFVDRFNEHVPEEERIMVTSNSWSEYSSSLALDAILRDLGERWGIVSVFSSGNDGKNNDRYEKTPSSSADNPYVIVVGNTSANDQLDSSSEFGTATVDLGAPGTNILSTAIPERGFYCPDASLDSNLLYLSFDGKDETPVNISQVFKTDSPKIYEDEELVKEDIAATTNLAHFSGRSCLKIDIDPQYTVGKAGWMDEKMCYDLQFNINLEGTDIARRFDGMKDLQLGVAFSADKNCSSQINVVSTNAAFITENVPVTAEDGQEKIVEITRPTAAMDSAYFDASDGQWGCATFNITCDSFINKDYNEGLDPNVTAVNPGNILSIKMRIGLPEGCTTIYLDSIGIGTQTIPYEFATGTSMACPAISGAAAVLASQGYKGTELASLVRSKVRIPESGALATRTSGVFDFTVAGSPDGDSENPSPLAPAINDITINNSAITITGSNFGTKQGKVELSRYIVGTDLKPVAARISSWADGKVTLESEAKFTGILQIVLTNAGGKHDTHLRFAGKSENVYEQDLPFDALTKDTAIFGDGLGDWETKGPLVGLDNKLYYLPAYCGQTDQYPAYRKMCCFDLTTQKWTDLPDLPEWLEGTSAVAYQGKIVVEGATMYVNEWGEPSNLFPSGKSEERVYVYDPGSREWTKASSAGMYLHQSILSYGGQLTLAGGCVPDPDDPDRDYLLDPAPLTTYDLKTGAKEVLCQLPCDYKNPVAAVKDGTILMYCNTTLGTFIRIQDGKAVLLEETLPDFFLAEGDEPVDSSWGPVINNPHQCVLSPISEGFILVGPPGKGGTSDTYILRDGTDKFQPYSKRASDDRTYSQAGCTYNGQLYLIASAWFEPGMRLFRSTAIATPDQPDVPDKPDDKPTPAEKEKIGKVLLSQSTFTYNGKVQKPSIKTIGGKSLKAGTDYTVTWSNKSSKNVGSYTLTVIGKGNYTGTAKAIYKINPKGTSLKKLKRTKKTVRVTWKKQSAKMSKSRITGYQIQIAANKKFTKNKKTLTVRGYKKVSKKITKLKGKKKYYIRIRTYKTIKGVKYHSPWSKVKKI